MKVSSAEAEGEDAGGPVTVEMDKLLEEEKERKELDVVTSGAPGLVAHHSVGSSLSVSLSLSDDDEEEDGGGAKAKTRKKVKSMKEHVKKFSSWECVTWHVFLLIFFIMVTLGRTNSDLNFTQSEATKNKFLGHLTFDPEFGAGEKTFEDITSFNDLYNYIGVVLKLALLESYPSGQPYEADNLMYHPLSGSRLLGGLRLRQVRYKRENCDGHNKVKFPNCYDLSATTTKDWKGPRGDIGPYKHRGASSLDDQVWRGKYNTYSGGGYVQDFPLNYTMSADILQYLRDGDWLDEATQLVTLDFNLYNPTSKLHTVARVAFEVSSGGLFGNYEIKTWLFARFLSDSAGAYIFCCATVIVFIIWFTFLMGREMYKDGCSCEKGKGYWGKTKWRYLDFINLLIFYAWFCIFAVNIRQTITTNLYETDKYQYTSLRRLQYLYLFEMSLLAFNGFLSFVKVFKYFAANQRLRFFFTMMGRAAADIFLFLLVLFVWFLAFGVYGFLTFSSDVDDFRSPFFSFFNLMRFVVSDLPYDRLANSSRTTGSGYYVVWSLLMALILANVFIALLSEAYSEVRNELKEGAGGGFFGGMFARRMDMVSKYIKSLALNRQHEDLDLDGDGQIDVDELIGKTQWTEEKAKAFMDRFDVDKSGALSIAEWTAMQKEDEELRNFEREWEEAESRKKMKQESKDVEREERKMLARMSSQQAIGSAVLHTRDPTAPDFSPIPGGVPSAVQSAELERLKDKLALVEDMLKLLIKKQVKNGDKVLARVERKAHQRTKRRTDMLKKARGMMEAEDLAGGGMESLKMVSETDHESESTSSVKPMESAAVTTIAPETRQTLDSHWSAADAAATAEEPVPEEQDIDA